MTTTIIIVALILAACGILVWALIEEAKARIKAEQRAKEATRKSDAIRQINETPKAESMQELVERHRRRMRRDNRL